MLMMDHAGFRLVSAPLGPKEAYPRLAHLDGTYPEFALWFWTKCAPGVANGTRKIFAIRSDSDYAIVIAKKALTERKLCTVFVSKGFENRGIGTRLIESALGWLECRKPLLTVPEERLPRFEPILARIGFSLSGIMDSCYRPGAREFIFNGHLFPASENHSSTIARRKASPSPAITSR
jgi:GNAT superfamily N-acetyltransferase